jgi:hypothetical protein
MQAHLFFEVAIKLLTVQQHPQAPSEPGEIFND